MKEMSMQEASCLVIGMRCQVEVVSGCHQYWAAKSGDAVVLIDQVEFAVLLTAVDAFRQRRGGGGMPSVIRGSQELECLRFVQGVV